MTVYLQNTSISFNRTPSCCLYVNALNNVNIVSTLVLAEFSLLSLLKFLSLFIKYQKWTSWWWWPWIIDPCLTGLRGSLSRLQLDYVDIVFANRNDVNSPMEGQLQVFVILVRWYQHTYIMWLRIRATTCDKVGPVEWRYLPWFAEIVRAMTFVINQGMAMYWGTSRWSAMEIMVNADLSFKRAQSFQM